MPMNEKEVQARDAKRDIGAELLASVKAMKAGRATRVTKVEVSPVAAARAKVGMTQARFAALMGVSVRTLQGWEQGRRQPGGAAKTLLRIADEHPEYLARLTG